MTIAEVTARLKFEPGAETAKANVAVLRVALDERKAEVAALRALLAASYELCPHKNKTAYSAPRDWGWTCHDCGFSR